VYGKGRQPPITGLGEVMASSGMAEDMDSPTHYQRVMGGPIRANGQNVGGETPVPAPPVKLTPGLTPNPFCFAVIATLRGTATALTRPLLHPRLMMSTGTAPHAPPVATAPLPLADLA
jgi:hypothetical protein